MKEKSSLKSYIRDIKNTLLNRIIAIIYLFLLMAACGFGIYSGFKILAHFQPVGRLVHMFLIEFTWLKSLGHKIVMLFLKKLSLFVGSIIFLGISIRGCGSLFRQLIKDTSLRSFLFSFIVALGIAIYMSAVTFALLYTLLIAKFWYNNVYFTILMTLLIGGIFFRKQRYDH